MEILKNEASVMPNAHLHEPFIDGLKQLLWAEMQMLKGLTKMAASAGSARLKTAFEDHSRQTNGHIDRLKEVFDSVGRTSKTKKCATLQSLMEDTEKIIEGSEDKIKRDAALISIAQRFEHYEMASYGCLITYAKLLEYARAQELLGTTINEERQMDSLLTDIAMSELIPMRRLGKP